MEVFITIYLSEFLNMKLLLLLIVLPYYVAGISSLLFLLSFVSILVFIILGQCVLDGTLFRNWQKQCVGGVEFICVDSYWKEIGLCGMLYDYMLY